MKCFYLCTMKTEIINIGDELLIGQVVNTNASWMSEQMSLAGFPVVRTTVIPDDRTEIMTALQEATERVDIILITGGLGPTKDDITKAVLGDFFHAKLVFSEAAYHDIEHLFAVRGFPVTALNRSQAEVPEGCEVILNRNGTAPGMWFEKEPGADGRPGTPVVVSMPGVPFEMKAMMSEQVIPRLREKLRPMAIYHKTIWTQGVGESFLSDMLEPWETKLPEGITLAYLPQPGIVRLRLTARGNDEAEIRRMTDGEVKKLEAIIPQYIYGYDEETLEEVTGRLLAERKATLAIAESCTGGYLAHLITSVAGSSRYFQGSVVAYANKVKEEILGVKRGTLEQHGAVSEQVVTEMALGVREKLHADYAIAVSGIAGPDGGTPEKPVGTAWIAIATPGGVFAKHYLMGDHRERNIRRVALEGLNMLRKAMISA